MPSIDPDRLRRARERRLLTQADLAARIGGSEATVNRLERGRNPARISTVRRLAEALGVPADELLA